jgi:hypothetical protein
MMSRLRSEDPAIEEPTKAVDTETPCFALADERDPSLFHPHDLRAAQISDPSCCRLHAQYGAHPSIEIDQNGLIGLVLPSGVPTRRPPFQASRSPSRSSIKSHARIPMKSQATRMRQT